MLFYISEHLKCYSVERVALLSANFLFVDLAYIDVPLLFRRYIRLNRLQGHGVLNPSYPVRDPAGGDSW